MTTTNSACVVAFVGLDGSGKSTLVECVKKELEERGLSTACLQERYKPRFMSFGENMLRFLTDATRTGNKETYVDWTTKGIGVGILCEVVLLLIMCIDFVLKIDADMRRVMNRKPSVLILDRYLEDFVATDVAPHISLVEPRTDRLASFMKHFVPKPSLVFYVTVPEEVSLRRKSDIPSFEYLRKRRMFYESLPSVRNAIVVDGQKDMHVNSELCSKAILALRKCQ